MAILTNTTILYTQLSEGRSYRAVTFPKRSLRWILYFDGRKSRGHWRYKTLIILFSFTFMSTFYHLQYVIPAQGCWKVLINKVDEVKCMVFEENSFVNHHLGVFFYLKWFPTTPKVFYILYEALKYYSRIYYIKSHHAEARCKAFQLKFTLTTAKWLVLVCYFCKLALILI